MEFNSAVYFPELKSNIKFRLFEMFELFLQSRELIYSYKKAYLDSKIQTLLLWKFILPKSLSLQSNLIEW